MAPTDSPKITTGVHEFVISVAADPGRGYPSGELVFSIDHGDAENVRLMVAGLHIPDRTGATESESFDGGFIVVRRSRSTGQLCGLQILRYEPGPASVPELMEEVVKRQDRFLLDAVTTVMMHWAPIDNLCSTSSQVAKLKREWLLAHEVGKIANKATREPIWRVVQQVA